MLLWRCFITWGTVSFAVNIGAWAWPRDMTTWSGDFRWFICSCLVRYMFSAYSHLCFSVLILFVSLLQRYIDLVQGRHSRALVALIEKSNRVRLVVAHLGFWTCFCKFSCRNRACHWSRLEILGSLIKAKCKDLKMARTLLMMSLGFAPRYDYFLGFIMFLAKVNLQTFLIFSLDLKQVSPNSIFTWPGSSTRGSSFKGNLTKIYVSEFNGNTPCPWNQFRSSDRACTKKAKCAKVT